jgi:hypothetical protein
MAMPIPRATRPTVVDMPSSSDTAGGTPAAASRRSTACLPGRFAGRGGQSRLVPQRAQIDGLAWIGAQCET